MPVALAGFATDCQQQRAFLGQRCPVYGALLDLLIAHHLTFQDCLADAWQSRHFSAWYDRPLLLLASLRFDALSEGPGHPLYQAVVEADLNTAKSLAALTDALAPERRQLWASLRQRSVQTNETSRAVTWLFPAAMLREQRPDARLALFDLGASAGLNLAGDRLPCIWADARGETLPCQPLPAIVGRTGYDQSPLDVARPDAALWLQACVWPGEQARLSRLAQGIEAFLALRSAGIVPRLESAKAAEMPAKLGAAGASLDPDVYALAYQTLMRDYLSETERENFQAGMQDWIQSRERALWVELETTPSSGRDMAITAHYLLDRKLRTTELAFCATHPSTITLNSDGLASLRRGFA